MRPWNILYMMYKYQATYFGTVDLCPLGFIFSCKIIPVAYPEESLNSGLCSDLCRESSGWVEFYHCCWWLVFCSFTLLLPCFTPLLLLFQPSLILILILFWLFQPSSLSLSPPSSFPLSTPRPLSLRQTHLIHSFGHLLKLSLCT